MVARAGKLKATSGRGRRPGRQSRRLMPWCRWCGESRIPRQNWYVMRRGLLCWSCFVQFKELMRTDPEQAEWLESKWNARR